MFGPLRTLVVVHIRQCELHKHVDPGYTLKYNCLKLLHLFVVAYDEMGARMNKE